jgi:hypothetical protein
MSSKCWAHKSYPVVANNKERPQRVASAVASVASGHIAAPLSWAHPQPRQRAHFFLAGEPTSSSPASPPSAPPATPLLSHQCYSLVARAQHISITLSWRHPNLGNCFLTGDPGASLLAEPLQPRRKLTPHHVHFEVASPAAPLQPLRRLDADLQRLTGLRPDLVQGELTPTTVFRLCSLLIC